MSKTKEQEALEKILELAKDEIDEAVKRSFYNYLVLGETPYEIHADGVKEVSTECPFCKPIFCEEPHCPYTEEE